MANETISQMTPVGSIAGTELFECSVSNGVGGYNTRSVTASILLAGAVSAGAAPLNSPAFTGTPTAPTTLTGDNTTQIATTAWVTGKAYLASAGVLAAVSGAGYALLASPTFTGTPAAPTAAPGTNTTQIATTAYSTAAITAQTAASFKRTAITGNYTVLSTDRSVCFSSLAGAATVTLPSSASFSAGTPLFIMDESGSCSATNTITINPAGTDTIDGVNTGGTYVLSAPYAFFVLESNGTGKWTQIGQNITHYPQCGLRLTLTSSAPVLTATVNAATSIFAAPYLNNLVQIWNGQSFVARALPTSPGFLTNILANSGTGNAGPTAVVSSNVYDLFIWDNAGTLTLTRGPTWAAGAVAGSNTQRGTGAGSSAIAQVQGVYVNSNGITNGPAAGFGTYVGTFASDGSGATVTWNLGSAAAGGGAATLNVWNMYNRVTFAPLVQDSTASHTYTTASIRAYDNSNTNRINLLFGLQEDGVDCKFASRIQTAGTTATGIVGIGLDSAVAFATNSSNGVFTTGASVGQCGVLSTWEGLPGLGVHFFQVLELGDGTNANIFYGTQYMNFSATVRM